MAKVTVSCSVPAGLILRLHKMVDVGEGFTKIVQSRPTGAAYELKFGRNDNVDADFIRAWQAQHPDQSHFISIHPGETSDG